MPRNKYEDDYARRSGTGSGRNSPHGGSRRESRDALSWDSDSSPESDHYRKSRRRTSTFRERNFFTDALDDLEMNIRKFEEESSVLVHDFNVIRNQHQSQAKRISDLMRNFEETRYRIDRINSRGYRNYGSDHLSDSSSEHRGSIHSLDRGERPGSFRDDRPGSTRSHRSRSSRMESPIDRDYSSRGEQEY